MRIEVYITYCNSRHNHPQYLSNPSLSILLPPHPHFSFHLPCLSTIHLLHFHLFLMYFFPFASPLYIYLSICLFLFLRFVPSLSLLLRCYFSFCVLCLPFLSLFDWYCIMCDIPHNVTQTHTNTHPHPTPHPHLNTHTHTDTHIQTPTPKHPSTHTTPIHIHFRINSFVATTAKHL